MKINNIIKLSAIRTKLALVKIKSALFMVILTAVMISLPIIWWKQSEQKKPVILIANEEKGMLASLTVNSILNNKIAEIVNFVTTDYAEGRKKINNGEALLLVHIKKGTIDTLYEGKKAELDIYTKNENNDFTKLIISYIKGFTDIINISQNAGLYYMDIMYKRGMSENERVQKFNELQASYVKLTLTRNSIFDGDDRVMGFNKKDIKVIYYLLTFIFLSGISFGLFVNSELIKKANRQRLILSGISELEIYFTVIFGIIIVDIIFMFIFNNLGKIIGVFN